MININPGVEIFFAFPHSQSHTYIFHDDQSKEKRKIVEPIERNEKKIAASKTFFVRVCSNNMTH